MGKIFWFLFSFKEMSNSEEERNLEDDEQTAREKQQMKELMKKYGVKAKDKEKKKKGGKKQLQVGPFEIGKLKTSERALNWKLYSDNIRKALELYEFTEKEKIIHFDLEIGKYEFTEKKGKIIHF
jgi:hypothetical protein